MDVNLYIREEGKLKFLKVPKYVIRDLLRDRLGESMIDRIHRFCEEVSEPSEFPVGSVVVDFFLRKAICYKADIDLKYLEPTWNVESEKVGLMNYA